MSYRWSGSSCCFLLPLMSLQRTLKTRLAIRPPGTGTFLLPGTSSRPPLSHFLPLRTPAGTITHCCFHCPRSWTCQGNCLSTQVPYFKLLLLNRSRPAGNYHMSYRWPGGNMSFCHFLCSLERTLEALWLLPPGGTCPVPAPTTDPTLVVRHAPLSHISCPRSWSAC
jgi:hypothetical protein